MSVFYVNCVGEEDPVPPHGRYWAIFQDCLYPISTILISVDLHRNGTEPHILAGLVGDVCFNGIPCTVRDIYAPGLVRKAGEPKIHY